MEENRIFERCPDVLERELDEEVVLLDTNTGIYYSLNEIGAGIWTALDGKRGAGEIADLVAENYDVERGTAEADVTELLADLLREKLIREAGT